MSFSKEVTMMVEKEREPEPEVSLGRKYCSVKRVVGLGGFVIQKRGYFQPAHVSPPKRRANFELFEKLLRCAFNL